jgi:hypothetical protein
MPLSNNESPLMSNKFHGKINFLMRKSIKNLAHHITLFNLIPVVSDLLYLPCLWGLEAYPFPNKIPQGAKRVLSVFLCIKHLFFICF